MFWLTKKILTAYKTEGFVAGEVFGPQGYGKTTYSLKVSHEVYKELGYSDPWSSALDSLYFDIKGALEILIEAYFQEKRIPVMIFDDAGIWLEKYSWQSQELRTFVRLYKLMRTLVSGVIFTTPSEGDLLKNVREKTWFKIKITRNGTASTGVRKARANIFVFSVKYKRHKLNETVEEKAVDNFRVNLPDDIYKKYIVKRKEEGILPQIKSLLDAYPDVKEKLKKKGIDLDQTDRNEFDGNELIENDSIEDHN